MIKNPNNKNPAAVALGKLAAGRPKTLTEEQRQIKREIMARARTHIVRPVKLNEGK